MRVFSALTSDAQGPMPEGPGAAFTFLFSFQAYQRMLVPVPPWSHQRSPPGLGIELCHLKPTVRILNLECPKLAPQLPPLPSLHQDALGPAGKQTPPVASPTALSPFFLAIEPGFVQIPMCPAPRETQGQCKPVTVTLSHLADEWSWLSI